VAACITNILTPSLFEGTAEWLTKCQSYEGGFSGEPGLEAHGGYTFCGYAALVLLGKEHLIDTKSLLRWAASRQMRLEGGFQGRTNKLVDGCYSFWQGGIFPLIHNVLEAQNSSAISHEKWMFDQTALQDYVLVNCQYHAGGLIDKPGKARDFYHTCYCLSGLSVAQHFILKHQMKTKAVGGDDNILKPIHPLYNICIDSALGTLKHFKTLPIP
jgi:protein farnesyltransferase subunit beta